MTLSIIIPVYNAAPWIRACIGSIIRAIGEVERAGGISPDRRESRSELNAGCGQWKVEMLCVDDGSTDDSSTILEDISRHSPPPPHLSTFTILHQQNRGVSAARNAALEAATGDWILCVDADDTIEPEWLVNLTKHVTDEVDWVHADAQYCFQGIGRASDGTYRTFLRDGWCVLNLFRRSLVGTTRFREGMRFKEDVIFFTELALKKPRIAWVREEGYNYRRHPGSAIEQRISEADSIRFCEEILKLDLPREDAGRTIGYDLVLWVKGRDWSKGYDPTRCAVLKFWRAGLTSGQLKVSDVRGWWRPGLRHWVKTGDLSWLVWTRDWRVRLEVAWRKLRGVKC